MSFGRDFRQDIPEAFPSTDAEIYFAYLVAPYWSNIDTRLDGQVNYEVYVMGESVISNDYLGRVSTFINSEQDPAFTGNWMIVVTWDGVHPFPHGNSAEQDRVDPYLQSVSNNNCCITLIYVAGTNLHAQNTKFYSYQHGKTFEFVHPVLFLHTKLCIHNSVQVQLSGSVDT